MAVEAPSIAQLSINTMRTLSMDAVQQANSGHPGTPMALAPASYVIWNQAMRYDPRHPHWPGRDRFVLSCGHASMLLYSLLHLTGVRHEDDADQLSITLDDIRNFRQLHSPCAGHPEYGEAAGIETTTGPLGQGVGNSVGMAAAAKWLASRYDRPGFELFGYNVYAFCSDGDVMEGIGCEAASLAGHLKLNNLCWIYDDNHITIEGNTELAFSENVAQRFQGLGWNTVLVEDANDLAAISAALAEFEATRDRPTLILLRSIIGYGSPNKADTHGAHGAPLGEDEVKLTKEVYGWPPDEKFLVPDEVRDHFQAGIGERGEALYDQWREAFKQYAQEFSDEAEQLNLIWSRQIPAGWDAHLPTYEANPKGKATRVISGEVLNRVAEAIPWFIGGSADLAPSNMSMLNDSSTGHFSSHEFGGRNFHWGVREHGMAAACNGLSLSGIRAYAATFFAFTDYMRPSMRLSAIMKQPVLYILTHDSIGLGEDGPTHQPAEHLAACRCIPGLDVIRPGDANEVSQAYRTLVARKDHPAALVLTRQGLPVLSRETFAPAEGVAQGAYVLADPQDGHPQVILMGTGSELSLCVAAYQQLSSEGIRARVVSMPCFEWFEEQTAGYRDEVLPPRITARVAVEAAIEQGWERYVGPQGRFIGMSGFGASAPFQQLYEHFGITTKSVVAAAKELLA